MWTDRNGNVVDCTNGVATKSGYNWNCTNCIDCTNCTNCTNCTYCTKCIDCIDCTYCTYCTNCTKCIDCIDCDKQPICIVTPKWVICIRETTMKIGCQDHFHSDWMSFNELTIKQMHPEALIWWQQWKPIIQAYLNTVN